MTFDALRWGAPEWLLPAAAAAAFTAMLVIRSYWRSAGASSMRASAAVLKMCGVAALLLCLVEPLAEETRPEPGANTFVILADNSASLAVREGRAARTRGDLLRERLSPDAGWLARVGQDFKVRSYVFDSRLRSVETFDKLTFDGEGSALRASLESIGRQYRDHHLAGVVLLTDGNATDVGGAGFDVDGLAPVYPVLLGEEGAVRDIAVAGVSVSQSNFEAAPVTVGVEIAHQGCGGSEVIVELLDESGARVDRAVERLAASEPLRTRFELSPPRPGVHFYTVRARKRSDVEAADESSAEPERSSEATLANNDRLVVVDTSGGPYRVLYVSGRPNWEFKFLRRALDEDKEIELVSLIRIAKREPMFDFRGRRGESTNPLFRGFGNEDEEDAERYDEPVLLRIGTLDAEELRLGFPTTEDQLFRYHAIILDDVEAEFFTEDQMALVRDFVSRRGGGFLMLGGQESFGKGRYARTPIGDVLPVYVRGATAAPPSAAGYRMELARDGWVETWTRLRRTEEEERRRVDGMPAFRTVNGVSGLKPGATVMATVRDEGGDAVPALVVQRFGKGRAGAVLVGDLWRWSLRRQPGQEDDPATAWRQAVRWLVADVPGRVEAETSKHQRGSDQRVALTVRVRDESYEPLDNALVSVAVSGPDGPRSELVAEASAREPGLYEAELVSGGVGAHRAAIRVSDPDGSEVAEKEIGWTSTPLVDEYRSLEPNRVLLERIARDSGGEMVHLEQLDRFASSLPSRDVPIKERWTYPLWHKWPVLAFVMFCLGAEWALRRWRGLP